MASILLHPTLARGGPPRGARLRATGSTRGTGDADPQAMAHTQLLFRDKARAKILAGATALADAVRITLGPKSRCVLVERKWGSPLVCNDGVTIAKEFELESPEEN